MGLRVVFMGTPDFAVESLKALYESEHEVVSVVTVEDKKAGRGQKVMESAVKKYAVANDLPVLQPSDLKEESFLKSLEGLNADLFVVVAFRMLPREVFSIPKLGTFNLHGSLLPQYRGAAPINWAVINGEQETGVTTFFIDDKMDTGNILLQATCPIERTDSAGSVHDKLMVVGANLVVETVDELESGSLQASPQKVDGVLNKAPKIFRETCLIDWSQPAEKLYNRIRGLSPYPGAYTTVLYKGNKKTFKVFETTIVEGENLKAGEVVIKEQQLLIGTGSDALSILQMQLEGKKRVGVKQFLNGVGAGEIALEKA